MKNVAILLALAAVVGCQPAVAPEPQAGDLNGLTLPLNADGRLKLEVAGAVANTPAEIALEVAEPLTLVAEGCFPEGAPGSDRTVRVPQLAGGFAAHPEIALRGLKLGNTRVAPIRAGLVRGVKDCRVTVGSDVLDLYALAVDLAHRTVRFAPAGSASAVTRTPGRDLTRIELTRDPQTDWLLLPVQMVQGDSRVTGPFALTTDSTRSHVSGQVAAGAGVRSASEIIEALHLPMQLPLPSGVGALILPTDRLELAPDLALPKEEVSVIAKWDRANPLGTLGSNGWGRCDALIDPRGHALVLSRPHQEAAHGAPRCGVPGAATEEACFQLENEKLPTGPRAIVTLWRELPRGGRVELEPVDAQGKVVPTSCRVGFTFSPQASGASLAQTFPWPTLARVMPECAQALASAQRFQFSVWSEGFDRTCPGSCAFAQDPVSARAVCSCEQSPEGAFEAVRPLFDHIEELLQQLPRASHPAEREPDAP